ncbi:hypothetical protein O6H91_20G045300 [Diphasiastrum complanatum]|uniref:Uncharacterized protein n=1 Tax=Diphasiastrum complanatum TaxID=34168 RepID=A0ACC2APW6_DIPCM|nr:hypothetical protein O6H91_20G045300 [Diphasiastrum complanatum]
MYNFSILEGYYFMNNGQRVVVRFEPCHGKFFWGYPWFMYKDMADNLRHLLYDIVALDSCLRAEIQAQMSLCHMFQDDFHVLGSHCAQYEF